MKPGLLAALTLAFGLAGCESVPLIDAARWGKVDELRAQLDAGSPTETRNGSGTTPLSAAAINNRLEAAQLLLERGADPDYSEYEGITPLRLAAERGHVEMVKLLVAHGATQTTERMRAQEKLTQTGDSRYGEIVKLLGQAPVIRRAANPAERIIENTPLHRPAPGNLNDDAYARMRASASLPPESKTVSSDVDSPSRRGAERPDDFALVIGIEKYSKLPDAQFAENDADAVKKHLLALGYPERNIIALKGGQATRGAIQGYVEEWLPKNAKPGSRVFVYFSGHGSPDIKTGDAYLVPWDGDAMFLKSTAYPLKSLYGSLSKLKAKRVLVALDSCFSGAGGRSVLAQGARPLVTRVDELLAPAGVTVLSAASGDEITATLAEQGHGAFTYYLLKAFNGGKLTAKAVYDDIKPRVQDEAHRQNREQTPLMIGDDASF